MKIIHVLPHNIEDFMAGNYDDFDHHSVRFVEKVKKFSQDSADFFDQEIWLLSKKGIKAVVQHKKGFPIRIFPVSLKSKFPAEISFSLLKEILKFKSQEKTVWHLHSYHLFMNGFFIPIFLKLKRQKFISHFHGGGPSFAGVRSVVYSIFQYLINLRISLNLASRVIVLNRDEEKRINRFVWVKKEKIFYFPSTTNKNSVETVEKLSIQNFRKTEGIKMIVAGRQAKINKKEFIPILKNFLSNNKNCFVKIAGLKQDDKDFNDLKKQLLNPDQLELTGWLTKEELIKALFDSNLYLHLFQYNEGSPITLIEALSVGLPVLAFDVEGIRDVIKNDYNGWLVKSPKEFQEKLSQIINIINDPEKIAEMKENCLETVKENFLDENYFPKLVEIYKNL